MRLVRPLRDSVGPRTAVLPLLIVAIATLWSFAGVVQCQLVDWDDLQLLIENEAYRGLTWDNFRWMFTTTLGGHYQPLTWLSYAVDYVVWDGLSPSGIHLTNLLLHLFTALVFYGVALKVLKLATSGTAPGAQAIGALTATLLFALHPLRVESVAWATERRDVLSGAWLVLSAWLYLRSTQVERRLWLLGGALVAFLASLLSKASGMTFPLVLLVLDAYPLRRIHLASDGEELPRGRRRVLLEKLPFLGVAGLAAGLAAYSQWHSRAMWSLEDHPPGLRLGQAAYGIIFYLWKTIWPANLIPLYEQDPTATPFEPAYMAGACVFLGISALVWWFRRRAPAMAAAWLCYLLLLAPVLGLFQSGPQIVADRYSYLPSMPLALLAGGGVVRLWSASATGRLARWALLAMLAAAVVVFGALTRNQVRVWIDSYTLWSTVIERAPQTGIAHANLATILNGRGEHPLAREHAQRALQRLPGNRVAHIALGRAALNLGDYETAERHLRIALEITGRIGKEEPSLLLALAATRTGQARFDEAEQAYRDLLNLDPREPQGRFAYAGFLAARGRFADAHEQLEEVVRVAPDWPEAWLRLGIVQRRRGDFQAARQALERGMAIAPRDVNLRTELAWVLATAPDGNVRDGGRALTLASGAVADSDGKSLRAIEALAAAQAETGDFASAAGAIETALANHPSVDKTAGERLNSQLSAYRASLPFREAVP